MLSQDFDILQDDSKDGLLSELSYSISPKLIKCDELCLQRLD